MNKIISYSSITTLIILLSACNPAPQTALDVEQPEGWDDDLALAIPEDLNPDPNILEIELEAKITDIEIIEGTTTPVWTYGGMLPGPLIKAKVGDTVIIHFKLATGFDYHSLAWIKCPQSDGWCSGRYPTASRTRR